MTNLHPWRTTQQTSGQIPPSNIRTLKQNSSLHKYCELKANQLNDCGLDMRVVLKPEVSLEWTPDSFKKYLFKAFVKLMYDKDSTTKLTTKEINKVYLELEKHLAEKLHVESIPFPSNEPEMKA
jgi:hypothetical protein